MNQKEYLNRVKKELGMKWDDIAKGAHINPITLKSYRMPETSKAYRPMPLLAKDAIERLREESIKGSERL